MADARGQHAETAGLFRLDQLVLKPRFLRRIAKDESDPVLFTRSFREAEPLVMIETRADLQFSPPGRGLVFRRGRQGVAEDTVQRRPFGKRYGVLGLTELLSEFVLRRWITRQ